MNYDDVRDMQTAFEAPQPDRPITNEELKTVYRRELRANLLLEEVAETIYAVGLAVRFGNVHAGEKPLVCYDPHEKLEEMNDWIKAGSSFADGEYARVEYDASKAKVDLVEYVDGLLDVEVIVHGSMDETGVWPYEPWDEVHQSNMAKLGPDGKPKRNAAGKIQKPEGWKKPDLATIIQRQRDEAAERDWLEAARKLVAKNGG